MRFRKINLKNEECNQSSNAAFTLAEVIITLVVIGVVAAVTVPVMMSNHSQRVDTERHANIVYKMANAMHLMKVHGDLDGRFENSYEFVNKLEKYIKISKKCTSENIEECWPVKKVTARSGETYEVKNAKTRGDILGSDINSPETPNAGIILADGAHIILTYNPEEDGFASGDEIKHVAGLLPVGEGLEEYKDYTNTAMRGIAFVFDVNGNRGPNRQELNLVKGETDETARYKDTRDIRSFNGAHFIAGDDPSADPCSNYDTYSHKVLLGNTCYFELESKYNYEDAQNICSQIVSGGTLATNPWNNVPTLCKEINNAGSFPFTSGYYWTESWHCATWYDPPCERVGAPYGFAALFPNCIERHSGERHSVSTLNHVLCAVTKS